MTILVHLTVLFCNLIDSIAIAGQLDHEGYCAVPPYRRCLSLGDIFSVYVGLSGRGRLRSIRFLISPHSAILPLVAIWRLKYAIAIANIISVRWKEGEGVEHGGLRAISIRQPWAHAILHLGKDVENRRWRPPYRGLILIQAGLKIERAEALKLKLDPDALPTGAIVGSVEMVDCVRTPKQVGEPWSVALDIEKSAPPKKRSHSRVL